MAGFYGNITNVARTQFQFDKVYSSRRAMDQNRFNDGVYLGRYVLVEYDDNGLDGMKNTTIGTDGAFYFGAPNDSTKLTWKNTEVNEVVYVIEDTDKYAFYKRNDKPASAKQDDAATFTRFTEGGEDAYTRNHAIDVVVYNSSRGFDSTVWQKVFSDNSEKYVMVAELNTVVPTFAIAADAPTMTPVAPHFDTKSTDVYYKLHVQNPWVVRVAEATGSQLSDSTTKWVTVNYNSEAAEGQRYSVEEVEKNAAIYFNKAGFDERSPNKVNGDNKITMNLVSSEQAIYDDHDNTTDAPIKAKDIQELTINLPAIGNMMSDAWDIIHGPNRDDSTVDSLQGRLNFFKEMSFNEIPVQSANGKYLVGSTINGNTPSLVANILDKNIVSPTDENTTYYSQDDPWISTDINVVYNEDNPDYHQQAIGIHHNFHGVEDTETESNKNNSTGDGVNAGQNDYLKFYTPYVDAAGHVVGNNIETVTLPYGFKTITVGDESSETNGVAAAAGDVVADNTQDTLTITPGNKWIHMGANSNTDVITLSHEVNTIDTTANNSTNLNVETGAQDEDNINIPDWTYDNAGHIISKKDHKYTLPYGFKTVKTNGRGTEVSENATDTPVTTDVVADNTQDTLTINSGNKWVRIDTDAVNDIITIRHDVHNTSSTNDTTDWTKTEANTTIPTVTYTYDEAGHYVGHHTENYKLPFGYGKIVGDNSTSTAATATYDELSIVSGDDWLTSSVSTDTVTITHDFKAVADTTSTVDKNTVTEDKDIIKLYTPIVDNKGHVVGKNLETVTLPYGYKTFTGDSGTTNADNTQDSMSVTGDDWVQTTVSNDKIAIAHIGPVSGTNTAATTPTPKFGETFSFNTYDFDNKGHNYNTTAHTVKIPNLTLTDAEANGADVITQLTFTNGTDSTLVSTRSNIGALKMTGYEKPTSLATEALSANESLNTVLGKLEYRLAKEVTDRTNIINNLDYSEDTNNTHIITQITQIDGKITNVARAAAGTLVLGSGYSVAEQGAAINSADSLNTAFGKLEKSLAEEKARAQAAEGQVLIDAKAYTDKVKDNLLGEDISETFDTLVEIQEWINGDGVNATELTAAIAAETSARESAFNALGTAAYTDSNQYADANILVDTRFAFATSDTEDPSFTTLSIAELFTLVADLQAQVNSLTIELNALKNNDTTE